MYCSSPISINHVLFSCPSLSFLRRTHLAFLPLVDAYSLLFSFFPPQSAVFPPQHCISFRLRLPPLNIMTASSLPSPGASALALRGYSQISGTVLQKIN